jgi:hypothetical protein
MAACTAWSFRGFSCCLKCSKLCNWYFQSWNCESSDRRTKESNLVLSGRDTFLQTTVSLWITKLLPQKPVWYHVVNITRCHGKLFVHMRDRKRVRSRQRSLLLRFPAQIETSVSREGTDTDHWSNSRLDIASLGVKSEAKLYMRKSLPGTTEWYKLL